MSLYLECTLDLCQFNSILGIVILDNFIFTLTWYSKRLDIVNERGLTGLFTISRLGCTFFKKSFKLITNILAKTFFSCSLCIVHIAIWRELWILEFFIITYYNFFRENENANINFFCYIFRWSVVLQKLTVNWWEGTKSWM